MNSLDKILHHKVFKLSYFRLGRIIERKNRFTVTMNLEGKRVNVHLTNTGRLLEFLEKDRLGLVVPIKGRKLRYRLVGIDMGDYYALIDTRLQNIVFEYLVDDGLIPWLDEFKIVKRNPRVNDSMLDYLLINERGEEILVETKSAVLLDESGAAMYPDCPSERGRRHIREIIELIRGGINAMLIFIAGLRGVRCFKPYKKGDPVIFDLLTFLYKRVSKSAIKSLSIYIDRDGFIVLDNPDLSICI